MKHLFDLLKIDEKYYKQYKEWSKEQNKKGIEMQKELVKKDDPFYSSYKCCWDMGFPYAGTIGGEETIEITPTSVGEVIVIKNSITREELDITDYESW